MDPLPHIYPTIQDHLQQLSRRHLQNRFLLQEGAARHLVNQLKSCRATFLHR